MHSTQSDYEFFLSNDFATYKGEWVAIYNGQIISHGKSLSNVVENAKVICLDRKFLLVKIPSEETMIF